MKYEFKSQQSTQTPWWNHHHFILFQMILALVLIIFTLRYMMANKTRTISDQKQVDQRTSRIKKKRGSRIRAEEQNTNTRKFQFKISQVQTEDQDINAYKRNSPSYVFQEQNDTLSEKITKRMNRFVPDSLIYRDKKELQEIQEKKQKQIQYRRDLERKKIQQQKKKKRQQEEKKRTQIQQKKIAQYQKKMEELIKLKQIQKKKQETELKNQEALSKNKVQTIQKSTSQKEDQRLVNRLTETVKTQNKQPRQILENIVPKNVEDKTKSLFKSPINQPLNGVYPQKQPQKGLFPQKQPQISIFDQNKKTQSPFPPIIKQQKNGLSGTSQGKQGIFQRQSQKLDLSKSPAQNPLQIIKAQRLRKQPNQSNQLDPSSGSVNFGAEYLQKIMEFADKAKQSCEITTRMNNFGGPKSSIKQLWQKSTSFISTINVSKSAQIQTFAFKLWNLIVNTLIRNSSSKQGIERMPAKPKTNTCQKNALNSYILTINIYRMLGHQKIWLIIFGKTLRLLQFIYKRKRVISDFKQLDLLANNHVIKQGQELAIKYLLRVDFLTYFLFGLTTFDPILFANYISSTSRQDKATVDQIMKVKYQWSYKQFWFLSELIMKNESKTYFKPILYMNLLSSMYLQAYQNKANNTKWKQFTHIYKFIMKEALTYTNSKQFKKYDQIRNILEWEDIEQRGFCFYGDDFCDQIAKLQSRFKEKEIQFKLQRDGFEDKSSIFYYFKGNL